jgi:hypothetical protein
MPWCGKSGCCLGQIYLIAFHAGRIYQLFPMLRRIGSPVFFAILLRIREPEAHDEAGVTELCSQALHSASAGPPGSPKPATARRGTAARAQPRREEPRAAGPLSAPSWPPGAARSAPGFPLDRAAALVDRMVQGTPPPQLQALIDSVAAGCSLRPLHPELTNYGELADRPQGRANDSGGVRIGIGGDFRTSPLAEPAIWPPWATTSFPSTLRRCQKRMETACRRCGDRMEMRFRPSPRRLPGSSLLGKRH